MVYSYTLHTIVHRFVLFCLNRFPFINCVFILVCIFRFRSHFEIVAHKAASQIKIDIKKVAMFLTHFPMSMTPH